MTLQEAQKLIDTIHGHWPKLGIKRAGKPNRDVYESWVKYLQPMDLTLTSHVVRDFFLGDVALPSGKKMPEFLDIRKAVRLRSGTVPERETFAAAKTQVIQLKDYEHGDYVRLQPPLFPQWESALPGGRVYRTPEGDWIGDIPYPVDWFDFTGYLLLSHPITNPAHLQYIHLMNPEQQARWIAQMEQWEQEKRIKHFTSGKGK